MRRRAGAADTSRRSQPSPNAQARRLDANHRALVVLFFHPCQRKQARNRPWRHSACGFDGSPQRLNRAHLQARAKVVLGEEASESDSLIR